MYFIYGSHANGVHIIYGVICGTVASKHWPFGLLAFWIHLVRLSVRLIISSCVDENMN